MRIKADVLTSVNSIPYDSWCTTFDFLVVFNGRRFIVRTRGTKISYDRWSDIAHVVSELPTARKPWYISSPRLRSNRDIPCVQWERATLPILNHIPQTFSLSFALFYRRVLARKNSVLLINVAINFGYEYFCFVIYFSKIFLSKLFDQIFVSKFFQKFFFFKVLLSMPPRL